MPASLKPFAKLSFLIYLKSCGLHFLCTSELRTYVNMKSYSIVQSCTINRKYKSKSNLRQGLCFVCIEHVCLCVNRPVGAPPSRTVVLFRGANVFCGPVRSSVGWGEALRGLMLRHKLQRPRQRPQSGYYYQLWVCL